MREVAPERSPRYRTVGRYRVYAELASGGMATVHLGCLLGSAGFSKLVAIKILHQEFAVEKEFVSGFLDEARLASSIHHPNVVASLDVVAEQGELLVVMEYVHGETLAALMRQARQTGDVPPPSVVTRVICDALEGLHAAHEASLAGQCLNIVHRDVSPQNIMVGADGNTRVLDFGIAQAALRSQVTAAGTIKGKLAYMSPEQVSGQAVDARTDIFATGVVLWEALTRRRLFFAPDSREVASLVLGSPIPAPSTIVPTLSPDLDRVVLRALERDREQRYQSAREFAQELRAACSEATRHEVADWVGRVAKDSLQKRSELLQATEASAIHTHTGIVAPAVVTGSAPQALPVVLESTQTHATSTTSISPAVAQRRERRVLPWLAAAAGVALAAAVWVMAARGPAPLAVAPVARPAPVQPPRAAAAAPAPTQPSLPALPVEALPLAPATSSGAVSAAPPASTQPKVVKTAVAGAAGRARNCSPPYRIDAAGVRRVKPECL